MEESNRYTYCSCSIPPSVAKTRTQISRIIIPSAMSSEMIITAAKTMRMISCTPCLVLNLCELVINSIVLRKLFFKMLINYCTLILPVTFSPSKSPLMCFVIFYNITINGVSSYIVLVCAFYENEFSIAADFCVLVIMYDAREDMLKPNLSSAALSDTPCQA